MLQGRTHDFTEGNSLNQGREVRKLRNITGSLKGVPAQGGPGWFRIPGGSFGAHSGFKGGGGLGTP